MPKYSPEEWERKKEELLDYLRENPTEPNKEVRKAGFDGTIRRFFRNKINDARIAAGVPEVKSSRGGYRRALSEEKEDYLILLYNCSFSIAYLAREFSINNLTVNNTLGRGRAEGKHIIDDPEERFNYAVKTYYSYKKSPKLTEKDKKLMRKISKQVILPLIREVTHFTLGDILRQADPYERLLNRMFMHGFPSKSDEVYETSQLVSELETILREDPSKLYSEESRKEVINKIKSEPIKRIKNGQYGFVPLSDEEKNEFEQILEELSPREEKILRMRYGIGESRDYNLKEIGDDFILSTERIRQIEKKALRKLRHSSKSRYLRKYVMSERMRMLKAYPERIARLEAESKGKDEKIGELESKLGVALETIREYGLKVTEEDLTQIYGGARELSEKLSLPVDEFELSVRTSNCLKNAEVETIGDLVQRTESELLRTKNLGRRSLNEIKKVLAEMGLTLGMKIKTSPDGDVDYKIQKFFQKYKKPFTYPDKKLEELLTYLSKPIGEVEFSDRIHNCFRRTNIKYIGELVQKSEADLWKIHYFGRGSLQEVKEALAFMGLQLGMKNIREHHTIEGEIPDASLQEILDKDTDELDLPPRLVYQLNQKFSPERQLSNKIENLIRETELSLFEYFTSYLCRSYYGKKVHEKGREGAKESVEMIKDALSKYGLRLGMKVYRFTILK